MGNENDWTVSNRKHYDFQRSKMWHIESRKISDGKTQGNWQA